MDYLEEYLYLCWVISTYVAGSFFSEYLKKKKKVILG